MSADLHNVCLGRLEAWTCEIGSPPCAASTLDASEENVGSNQRPRTPVPSLPPPFPPSSLLGRSNLLWLITKFPYDVQHSCLITGNLYLLGRPQRGKPTKIFSVKMVQCLWKNSLAAPQMVRHRKLPQDPAILFLGIYPREMETHVHINLYMNVYSSIHDSRKVDPSTDELMY